MTTNTAEYDDESLVPTERGSAPAAAPATFSRAVSFNYSVAKVAAIFVVVLGHYGAGSVMWIPTTFGLFIFAFSSGFFTLKIYGQDIDRPKFWRKKLERLGLRFWVILAVLSVIVALQGKTVLHWHTLVHFAGLSGVLNWIPVPNQSGLGGGLWFFSLLLMFYIAYPYLAQMRASRLGAAAVAVAGIAAAIYLEETVKVGHQLWLTGLGFILGVAYAAHEVEIRSELCAAAAFVLCSAMLALNLLGDYKQLNVALVTLSSIALAVWLTRTELPSMAFTKLIARLDKYLLEIFLMHGYLFVRMTGNWLADLVISLCVVLAVSVAVHKTAEIVTRRVLDRRVPQR